MSRRSPRKAEFYALCSELRGCGLRPTHVAKVLQANTKYTCDVLRELGLYDGAQDRSAAQAMDRLPADVRRRVESFRQRDKTIRPMVKVRDKAA